MTNIPQLWEIVQAVQQTPDPSPVAEMAKAACMIQGRQPYDQVFVSGYYLQAWQAKIVEAQIMLLIGDLKS